MELEGKGEIILWPRTDLRFLGDGQRIRVNREGGEYAERVREREKV